MSNFCEQGDLTIQMPLMSHQQRYPFLFGTDLISIKHDLVCHQKYNKELTVIRTKVMNNSPIWSHDILTYFQLRQQGQIQVHKNGLLHYKK